MNISNQDGLLGRSLLWIVAVLLVQSAVRAEPAPSGSGGASLADMPEADWEDEPPPEKPIVRTGFVVLPFLGLAIAGSGKTTAELACKAGNCTSASLDRDYSQNANILLGMDGLYQILPQLRLGAGMQWIPTVDVNVSSGNSSTEFGSELSPVVIVEGIFGGKSAGAIRGFVGANFLFPDGELQDLIDAEDAACKTIVSQGGSCSLDSGPYTGLTFGAAGAFVGRVSEAVALRIELSVQRVGFAGPSLEVADTTGNRYVDSLKWSGTRFSLRFGVEF